MFDRRGARLATGDNIVFPKTMIPSNGIVWENLARRGVEVRPVPVDPSGEVRLDRLAAAIDARTKLVSVSWVGFASGYRIDLDGICEVVSIQTGAAHAGRDSRIGVFRWMFASIHSISSSPMVTNGCSGPEGAGFLYIREDHLERIRPTMVGWGSVQAAGQFACGPFAMETRCSRFEPGSPNMVGLLGLRASLRMLLGTRHREGDLATSILSISERLRERLQQIGAVCVGGDAASHRSGIVSFDLPGKDPQSIRTSLARGWRCDLRSSRTLGRQPARLQR